MISILEHGTQYKSQKTFLCSNCSCKFQATIDEWIGNHSLNNPLVIKTVCRCPECGIFAEEMEEIK